MLSRRVFMLSVFAVPGLSLLQRTAIAGALNSNKVLVLSENSCIDTRNFSTCLPVTPFDTDPASTLLELDDSFREGEYEFVFGLTRDSNFFLVEQYAQSSAYQLVYQGAHKYKSTGLYHSFRSNQPVTEYLRSRIAKDPEDWINLVSQVPGLSSFDDALFTAYVDLNTSLAAASKSPGQLVSWLFKRNPT